MESEKKWNGSTEFFLMIERKITDKERSYKNAKEF